MQIAVYDDRYQPTRSASKPEWQRWTSKKAIGSRRTRSSRYQTKGSSEQWSELRYRHLVPEPEQWDAVLNDQTPARAPRATLVTDFYSYNTNMMAECVELLDESRRKPGRCVDAAALGGRSDAAGRYRGPKPAAGASVRLELVKAGIAAPLHDRPGDRNRGRDSRRRGARPLGDAIKGTGRHHVDFANVDDRVSLVVDGHPSGGDGIEYDSPRVDPDPDRSRPGAGGHRSPKRRGCRERPCPEAGYLLYPDPGNNDYSLVWDQNYPAVTRRAPRLPVGSFAVSEPGERKIIGV